MEGSKSKQMYNSLLSTLIKHKPSSSPYVEHVKEQEQSVKKVDE
jgi:hypothetical protein